MDIADRSLYDSTLIGLCHELNAKADLSEELGKGVWGAIRSPSSSSRASETAFSSDLTTSTQSFGKYPFRHTSPGASPAPQPNTPIAKRKVEHVGTFVDCDCAFSLDTPASCLSGTPSSVTSTADQTPSWGKTQEDSFTFNNDSFGRSPTIVGESVRRTSTSSLPSFTQMQSLLTEGRVSPAYTPVMEEPLSMYTATSSSPGLHPKEMDEDDSLEDGPISRLNEDYVLLTDPPCDTLSFPSEQKGAPRSVGGCATQFPQEANQGNYGKVTCVQNRIDKKRYAVKRIDKPLNGVQQELDEIKKEVYVMAWLENEGIVRYFTSWVEPTGHFCILTEWCQGGDARRFFATPRNEIYLMELTAQIATALDLIHDMGWVHLDIKFDNILVFKDERRSSITTPLLKPGFEAPIFKICDFGKSREALVSSFTCEGLGDGRYTDPDIMNPPITTTALYAADCYSLGTSVMECAKGVPFSRCILGGEPGWMKTGSRAVEVAKLSEESGVSENVADVIISMVLPTHEKTNGVSERAKAAEIAHNARRVVRELSLQ